MSHTAEAVEAVSKHFNSAEMTEGRMFRKIMREIRPHVTTLEFMVLMFIFDRTYTYGKIAEAIPMKHFTQGVITGSGEILHPRLHKSERVIYRALKKLIDNVIIISSKPYQTATPSYAINPIWTPHLCQKRQKVVPKTTQASDVGETYNNIDINTHEHEQVALRASAREEDMQSAKERLLATVATATEKSKAARTKNKNKQNATGLMKTWEDAFIEVYPEETYFRWRVYEQSAFKKAVERGVPSPEISDFVAFCVTAFDNVINEHFSWMKAKPTIANVGFVTKHIAEFYQSFNDSKDPNRRLRGRIKREEPRDAPLADRPERAKGNSDAEVERLKQENEKLKAKLGEKATTRRVKLKKRVATRRSSDAEFGSWEG